LSAFASTSSIQKATLPRFLRCALSMWPIKSCGQRVTYLSELYLRAMDSSPLKALPTTPRAVGLVGPRPGLTDTVGSQPRRPHAV
jgi:hypothetical protein